MRRHAWLLATLCLAQLAQTDGASAAGQVPACAAGGADFCEFDRPEDLAALPGTPWLAVSQNSLSTPIVLLNPRTGSRRSYDPSQREDPPQRSARGCSGPPDRVDAGGIDVRKVNGQLWLAALNRSTPQRIELFVVKGLLAEPTVVWHDCVPVPSAYAINDVALARDGSALDLQQGCLGRRARQRAPHDHLLRDGLVRRDSRIGAVICRAAVGSGRIDA